MDSPGRTPMPGRTPASRTPTPRSGSRSGSPKSRSGSPTSKTSNSSKSRSPDREFYTSPVSSVDSSPSSVEKNHSYTEGAYGIEIPIKYYYIKGDPKLTDTQYDMIPNVQLINVKDTSSYPHFKKDYFYTIDSHTNAGFGFKFPKVKEMEKERIQSEGEEKKIKTYYIKHSFISPEKFRRLIPSARLKNVNTFTLFTPGLYYESLDQRFAGFGFTFKELVKSEKERAKRFIERYKTHLPLRGGTKKKMASGIRRTTRRRA
jgi:hypothetical protein